MPQASTAISASAAARASGKPSQWDASEPMAARPATASGHQGLTGSGAGSACASPAISGVKPRERTAARTGSSAWGSWVTVSTLCMRLNSMPATPAMPPSFVRNSASSVGQSICRMRIGVCTPEPATTSLERARGAGMATPVVHPPQQAFGPGSWVGAWSWCSGAVIRVFTWKLALLRNLKLL